MENSRAASLGKLPAFAQRCRTLRVILHGQDAAGRFWMDNMQKCLIIIMDRSGKKKADTEVPAFFLYGSQHIKVMRPGERFLEK